MMNQRTEQVQFEEMDRRLKISRDDRATGVRTWRVTIALSESVQLKTESTVIIGPWKSEANNVEVDDTVIDFSLGLPFLLVNRQPAEQKH